MWDDIEYQGDFYEHNFNDSDSDMDYSSAQKFSMIKGAKAAVVGESKTQDGYKSVWKHGIAADLNVRRFPAILRTNRQIYSEALSLLYTELELHLQPGDVLCMNTGKDIVKASERVWRHNPLQGIGTTNPNGQTIYPKPELDGPMEPHVLARFKKIIFEMDFSWEMETLEAETDRNAEGEQNVQDPIAPSLFVNEDLTINPEDEAKLLAFYRRSTIIHQLVKILSNSSDIVRLDMRLDVEVLCHDHIILDSDSENDDESNEATRNTDVANERAIEIFLDSGLLKPLEKLSVVRSFNFEFDRPDFTDRESSVEQGWGFWKPKPEYGRMLSDLKQKIERNYHVEDD